METVQIEVLLGIIAFCANTFLGVMVVLKNNKSWTNRLFFNLSIIINLYIVVNFISLHPPGGPGSSQLFWVRMVMFTCSFIGPNLILLAHTFPYDKIRMGKKFLQPLLLLMLLSAAASILPYVFTDIKYPGGQPVPTPGPGIIIFFADFVGLFILSFIILIVRYKKAVGEEKAKIKYLLLGVLASFSLMGLFTVSFVVILKTSAFVFLGPIFPVILMAFIAYAIVKHKLFDLKVIATQALTVVLGTILFSKIFISRTQTERVIDICIFAATLIFGYLLIHSVKKEVKQREELQVLTEKLAEANEKLKALDQARAEFISIASHQLRTPPATVKWYLSTILAGDYGKVPKNIKETLVKTERSNNLLISLIEDILNVSRIERGTMEFLFEETDPLVLAKTTFEQLQGLAAEKNIKYEFKASARRFPKITADKEKLRQVMNNLIDNAIKYTQEGKIEISLAQKQNEIYFAVTDTGKGIPPEESQNIFKKYTRGKESIKQSAGLGLGLYVAKMVIEHHNGKIWAQSPGLGKGSTFAFSIPINGPNKQSDSVDFSQEYKNPSR